MLEYFSFVSNPIDLFGARFESENLSSITVKVSGLSVYSESDGLGLACRAGEIFSNERSHRKKFSRNLEFFTQWKTGERKKVLPRG